MERSIVRIYAAATCFAAAICITISAGIVLYSIIQVSAPAITSFSYPGQQQLATVYTAADGTVAVSDAVQTADPARPDPNVPTVEQLAQIRESQQTAATASLAFERANGLRSLVLWGVVLTMSSILWFLHWRILRRGPLVGA